jgi:hypothetical protein
LAISGNPVPAKTGVYIWQPPAKPVTVLLSLDVVDRMLQDVMRGFGAVPRRGAEVGGILLGKSTLSDKLDVGVDDYELVPIEYRLGPSYLLSAADQLAFEETLDRLREAGLRTGAQPVGFFRSQTRDAGGLVPEDLALIEQHFPEPDKIVLLIKPFATRVCTAGFYFRENGSFQSGPALAEFNFRRKDLAGGDESPAPPKSVDAVSSDGPAADRIAAGSVAATPLRSLPEELSQRRREAPDERAYAPAQSRTAVQPSLDDQSYRELQAALSSRSRGSWVWLPLSFIFLLLGVLLGFQASLTFRPQISAGDPLNIGLTVTRDGDNLSVHWDRQAPGIRAATQGLLMIGDGTSSRPVILTADQLQTGSVVYPHKIGEVQFRLELTLKSGAILSQRVDWKE